MDKHRVIKALDVAISLLISESEQEGYGAPPSADMNPHDFQPDAELCSQHEIDAWKLACQRYDALEKVEVPTHQWIIEGTTAIHIANEPWGIGTYIYRDEEAAEAVEILMELRAQWKKRP